jgi:glycosyltransferase involved in cell wall biosynthesis
MNILIVSNLYPPNVVGGYERLCFEVASALVDANHRISVLTSNYGGKLADYPGQDVDRSLRMLADTDDIYKGFSASESEKKAINDHNLAVLERKLAVVQPDVVFVWNLFFLDASFLSAIQSSGVRTVFLLTDNWLILFLKPAFWYRYFTGGVLASRSWPAVIRSALGNLWARMFPDNISIAGEAIFPSLFMQAFYAQAGCRFQKSVVIPHGVHLLSHEEDAYRNRLEAVEKGGIHLLFAGRVVEMKGVHTILEALPEIIQDCRIHR